MVASRSSTVSALRISAFLSPLTITSGQRGLLLYCDDMENP